MVRRAGLSLAGTGRFARSEDQRPIIRSGECQVFSGNRQLSFSFAGADVNVELGSVYDGEIVIIK